jgi:hypothetical protein
VETALNIERPMQIGQSILLNELLPLQQFVRGELRRLRRRLLNVRLWSGVLDVGSWLVAIVGFTLIVDLLFRLDQAARMILLALGIGLASWRLYRSLLRPMLHHIDDLRLAQLLDRKHSGMGQQITNVEGKRSAAAGRGLESVGRQQETSLGVGGPGGPRCVTDHDVRLLARRMPGLGASLAIRV